MRGLGRKVLASLVLTIIAVGVTLLKGDVPSNLSSFLQFLFGALVLGNGIEHVTDAYVDGKSIPGPKDGVNLSQTHDKIDDLKATVTALGDNDQKIAEQVVQVQQAISAIVSKLWPTK